MKLISPIKSLTAVGFLLVSLTTLNLLAAETEKEKKKDKVETQEDCTNAATIVGYAKCDRDNLNPSIKDEDKPGVLTKCQTGVDNKVKSACADKPTRAQIREDKNLCTTAMDKYNKVTSEAKIACNSLDKIDSTSKDSCEARLESCRNKFESAYGGTSSSGAGNNELFNSMMGVYVQNEFPGVNPNDFPVDGGSTGKSCVRFTSKEDKKEKKNDEKERQREIQKLTEKIQEEEKEKTKKNAELREKNVEIDTYLQKVDEAVKKAIRSVDEKKGERLRKLNEDLAKSAIGIRKKNEEIIQEKEKVERIKFDNAQKMMHFTQDKISTRCQSEIDMAKQCFIQSSKGQVSSDPKSPCAGLTITSKGAKGTAQLKAKVAKVKEACFEAASMGVNKNKFDLATTLRSSEMSLLNKNNEITDAKNDIERRQNDYASITAESDKEKSDEEKSAEKQIENFKTKLERITQSTQEALINSDKKIAQLNEEILKMKQKVFMAEAGLTENGKLDTDVLDKATTAIEDKENERASAIAACCPTDYKIDPNAFYSKEEIAKLTGDCSRLVRGGSLQVEGKKGKPTKGVIVTPSSEK